jgi:formylglycine-generating enzyme required for sulfatase activity
LQNLALAMHDDLRGRQVQIARYAAARVIAPGLREVPPDEQHAAAERFLIDEELDSGIVMSRGDDVRFWHLTFQEYLTARALAACSDHDQRDRLFVQPKLYQNEWREVVLLMAGVLCHQGFERVDRMFGGILGPLGDQPSLADRARCVGLLGAAVRDLAPAKYQPGDQRYHQALQAVLGLFDADRAGEVPIKEAIEAADALGQAGDPRFESDQRDKNWITIPAGEFWMGAQKESRTDRNYDPEAGSIRSELPVHRVWLDEYRIAKYPVTVGEYREFIDAGGYQDQGFWQAGGFGQFERPDFWDDQLQFPARPVIYVSWFEAAAYAAWKGYHLPTEAQWERAARGTDARRYPWGDEDPDDRRLNYVARIGHPTAVGLYPRGNTPDGICDLAGNVWEWCWDWCANYSKDRQENPQGPSAGSSRVLRGGSWLVFGAYNCRSACRNADDPRYRYDHGLGFRLCVSSLVLRPSRPE